jgi:probable phosphoglycerate mutase
MTRILLTRHGHVEGISPERFRGQIDLPLTETGRAQARELGKRIAGEWRPAAIYTGPLQRAVATGDAIAKATGAPLRELKSLIDINYGEWQGHTLEDVKGHSPALFALWRHAPQFMRFPGGDSLQDLIARGADALRFALDHHHDETIVFVGHDSVNKAILLQVLDQPTSAYWRLTQDPCALNEFEITRSHTHVISLNDTRHLAGLAVALS